jgi:hypothetical protein
MPAQFGENALVLFVIATWMELEVTFLLPDATVLQSPDVNSRLRHRKSRLGYFVRSPNRPDKFWDSNSKFGHSCFLSHPLPLIIH